MLKDILILRETINNQIIDSKKALNLFDNILKLF